MNKDILIKKYVYSYNYEYLLWNVMILAFIYFIFIIIMYYINKKKNINNIYIFILLFYHTFFSILTYYYVIADSVAYYNMATTSNKYGSIFGNYDIFFMYSLLYFFIHIFKMTFLSCTLIFNLIGFAGLYFLYLAILEYMKFEAGEGSYLKYLMFLPSLSFWTGFAGKDAITFMSLGLFVYSLININKRIILIIIAMGIMAHVRPYMLIIVSSSFLLAILFSKDTNMIFKNILIILIIGIIFFGKSIIADSYGIEFTNVKHSIEMIEKTQGEWGGGSDINIKKYNIFMKVFTFLFRPLFIDAHNAISIISSFENIALLFLSLCIFNPKYIKSILKENTLFSKFVLFYFVISTILLSYTNANLGTIVRKRVMVLNSLICLITIYKYKYRKLKIN